VTPGHSSTILEPPHISTRLLFPRRPLRRPGVALDTNAANATPVIASVDGPESSFVRDVYQPAQSIEYSEAHHDHFCRPDAGTESRLRSTGSRRTGQPISYHPDYGFGSRGAGRNTGTVTLNGVPWLSMPGRQLLSPQHCRVMRKPAGLMVRRSTGTGRKSGLLFNIVNCSTTQILTSGPGRATGGGRRCQCGGAYPGCPGYLTMKCDHEQAGSPAGAGL